LFIVESVKEENKMKITFLTMLLLAVSPTLAQEAEQRAAAKKAAAKSGELFDAILRADAAIFEAFNAHDVGRLMSMFTEDLEFYDDGDGLSNHAQTKQDFEKMLPANPGLRRELVKESLEVYPVKNYGAIEIGEHRFCHKENGKEDCGIFKFAMVWRKTGNDWKISRVISYGH
jgi:ketosteroid isomerase-like protein